MLLPIFSAQGATQHYRLILTEKPANSVRIAWELIGGCPDTQRVYYDTIDYGQDTSAYAFQATLTASYYHQGMENYFCHLKELQPDTRYYFVIAEDQGISPRLWFKTLSKKDHPWKARWTSPALSQSPQQWKQFCQQTAQSSSDFVLVEGLSQLKTEQAWRQWLEGWQLSIAENGHIVPLIMVGEHTSDMRYLFNLPEGSAYCYSLNQKSSLVVAPGKKIPKKRFWKNLASDAFVLFHSLFATEYLSPWVNLTLTESSPNAQLIDNIFFFPAEDSFVEMIWQENQLQILSPQKTRLLDVFASP